MPLSYCIAEGKPCVRWVEKYFKDCLCNLRDDFFFNFSFSFGLVSLVCWGVAEIPKIITNFQTKLSHGISLAFLLLGLPGDAEELCIFEEKSGRASDLIGCVRDCCIHESSVDGFNLWGFS
ncbi:uncharacterized protein LOC133712028 [Rosa rugosa]|uniref:uncharacterized protein LOC133712028 n=1 Tax=Rosa rugosa TaxID=74645 RepID=UPI002B400D7C|nr:uncharacterized protein LOC133712028 [Rosa rugosa]